MANETQRASVPMFRANSHSNTSRQRAEKDLFCGAGHTSTPLPLTHVDRVQSAEREGGGRTARWAAGPCARRHVSANAGTGHAPSHRPEPRWVLTQRPVRRLPAAVTIFSSSAFHLDQCLSFFLWILTFSTVLLLLCLCRKAVGAQNLQTGWGVGECVNQRNAWLS